MIDRMPDIREHIAKEIEIADGFVSTGELSRAFLHLERAHVLGQSFTADHTRIHLRMLRIGWRRKDVREIFGQVLRIVGAATKTAFGIYPKGNTGGANVYFFQPMPIAPDLQAILDSGKNELT